jgi:hypothetical protein
MIKKCIEQECVLGPEKPYISAIRAVMYLSNQIRPEISVAVSLLAQQSVKPTIRLWNGVKRIFKY